MTYSALSYHTTVPIAEAKRLEAKGWRILSITGDKALVGATADQHRELVVEREAAEEAAKQSAAAKPAKARNSKEPVKGEEKTDV